MTKPSVVLALAAGLALTVAAPVPAPAQQLPGEAVVFESHGAKLQGRFFRASGTDLHPTVLLLHGYPGNPTDVLGLGAALAGSGWNALMFNYRGFYGSEGRHTPLNSMEDVSAALGFLGASAGPLRADTGRLALVGYSYGGWLALMTGGREPAVKCVAAIAPGNMALQGRMMARDSSLRARLRESIEAPIRAGRIRSMPFDSMAALLRERADELDSTARAATLAAKPVLVVGGWRDPMATLEQYVAPPVRALRAAGNTRVTPVTLDDDHTFAATRAELHRQVIGWLGTACAAAAAAPTPAPARD